MTQKQALKQAANLAAKHGTAHLVYYDPDYDTFKVMSEKFFYVGTISENEIIAQVEPCGYTEVFTQ